MATGLDRGARIPQKVADARLDPDHPQIRRLQGLPEFQHRKTTVKRALRRGLAQFGVFLDDSDDLPFPALRVNFQLAGMGMPRSDLEVTQRSRFCRGGERGGDRLPGERQGRGGSKGGSTGGHGRDSSEFPAAGRGLDFAIFFPAHFARTRAQCRLMNHRRFEHQTAIVTGGADGIGKAIVQRLAAEGADVTLFDVSAAKASEAVTALAGEGLRVHAETVNIAEESEVAAGFAAVAARSGGGRLDIMINCAAIVGPTNRRITEVTTAEFDLETAINLRGTFLMTKHALLAMAPRNYGRVLNFASIAGKEGNAGMSPYSATKAGVIGLVKSAGKEFAETGITVNAIAPAVIRTPMVDGIHPDQVKYMTDKIPMKRCGTLDEVSALSCWIVSPEASFCTAFTFDLSGGRAVY